MDAMMNRHGTSDHSGRHAVKEFAFFHGSFFQGLLPLLVASAIALSAGSTFAAKKWVGTWTTAPQLVESSNLPPSPYQTLANSTLRQVVCVSIGGDTVRVRFANNYSTSPVTINSANIALSKGTSVIDTTTLTQLKFGGSASVTMAAGSSVTSDPVAFNVTPRKLVAITTCYGSTSSSITGHPGSRTTSYIVAGDKSTAATLSGATSTAHWYNINTIDVWAPDTAAAIAILGNSITDGRGSTTDGQNRWPDILAQRLLANPATSQVGVLNLGLGGNCVYSLNSKCLGPAAASRYQRDILDQQGVRWVILFEGVNDIGILINSAATATTVADSLILTYKQMIAAARAKNLKVYGATIMPFAGTTYSNNQYNESCRQTVNAWIRTSGFFDTVIDFDKLTRSTTDSSKLGIPSYQSDGLHPDSNGHKLMGNSIGLNLFNPTTVGVKRASVADAGAWGHIRTERVNGAVKVTFAVPRESFVSLKVYSLLGREIGELAGKKFSAGEHTITFRGQAPARGMCIYALKADGVTTSQLVY